MRICVPKSTLIILGLLCLAAPYSNAGAPAIECTIAGPEDPSVDGDLDGVLWQVDDPTSVPAPSGCGRPRVSECARPASCEVRITQSRGRAGPQFPDDKEKAHD